MTDSQQLTPEQLTDLVREALSDMKALDVTVIDVRGKTAITDIMVVATGTSTRHVKSIAESVVFKAKQLGITPLGTEGEGSMEWMLVDLNDVVVHVMLQDVRGFYNLERLWELDIEDMKGSSDEVVS